MQAKSIMWSRLRAGLLLAGFLLSAGCRSIGPDYRVPETGTPSGWQAPVGESPEVLAEWWTVFQDPLLAELVGDARARNYDLVAAAARLDSYAAAYGMAQAERLPNVGAQGSVGWERETERVRTPAGYSAPDNPGWLYQGGFTMAWELDLWGRVRRSVESAQGQLDASLEDWRNLTVLLQAQVASEYILLRTSQQRIAFAEANVQLQAKTLQLVRSRFEAGLTGELDVRQAEMNLAATKAQIPPLRAKQAETLHALCQLTGRLPGSLDHLLEPKAVPSADELPGLLPAELLRRRPDIRAAERNLAAQTAKIGVAKADYLPLFALNGNFALAATDSDELWTNAARKFAFGPSLRWSIFNAGKVRNRVRAEEAATEALLARYEQTVLVAYRECETALAAYQHEMARLAALHEAVQAAGQSVALANDLYGSGLANFQNVLDMQRQLTQYQDAQAQSMGQRAANLVAVYKAFGGGWDAGE